MRHPVTSKRAGQWMCPVYIAALVLAGTMGMTSCDSQDELAHADRTPLNIKVVNHMPDVHSREAVTGTTLPNGSCIGFTLTDSEGLDYDSNGYSNLCYQASGTGSAQAWYANGTVATLSTTEGVGVAYYPYSESATDITAIDIETASQTDYMYSGEVTGLNNKMPYAQISMKHIMTDLRIVIVNDGYTGNATLTGITVESPFFATSATMNARTGELDRITGTGAEFTVSDAGTGITAEGFQQDFLVIPDPTVTSGQMKVWVQLTEGKFLATVDVSSAFQSGKCYQYTFNLQNNGLGLASANVTTWDTKDEVTGSMTKQ